MFPRNESYYDFLTNLLGPFSPPLPKRIERSGDVTRVHWNDGTVTAVRLCEQDKGHDSNYVAFCAALAKRLYGSNSALHSIVDESMADHQDAVIAEARKARAEREEENKRIAHDRKVRRLAKQLRLLQEAAALNEAMEVKSDAQQ